MISIWHWHTEPLLIGGILATVWVYCVLVGPFRFWLDIHADFPKQEFCWFLVAILSFYLAVGSPLDALGENYLFSAHMLQHIILMYGTALFFIWGMPTWLVDGLLSKNRILLGLFKFLLHPIIAGFSFVFVFSVWHFPLLYEAALHDKLIHAIEHLSMLGVSILMLWPIFGESKLVPRAAWGTQIIYLFLVSVAMLPLFAILTFSPDVLYPTYDLAPRVIDLSPMQDQILGSLIMKISGMLLLLGLAGRAFYHWYLESK